MSYVELLYTLGPTVLYGCAFRRNSAAWVEIDKAYNYIAIGFTTYA